MYSLKQGLKENFMQFVSLPKQLFPNRPSEHWQCPSYPQVPWPLHVVLGLQNSKTNEKKVSKNTAKSENNEDLIIYLYNQLQRTDCHNHKYRPLCRFHYHCNWLQLHMQLSKTKKNKSCCINFKFWCSSMTFSTIFTIK